MFLYLEIDDALTFNNKLYVAIPINENTKSSNTENIQ
jgi:hypothetical protein